MKWISLFLIFMLSGCSSDPDTSQAKPYQLNKIEDSSYPGRVRYSVSISSSEVTTHEEFAQTAIRAALNVQRSKNADVVWVYLEPSEAVAGYGLAYAIANYSPDGGGNDGSQGWTWEVSAAEKLIPEIELMVVEEWREHRGKFQVNGLTDEPALKAYLSKKLDISVQDIGLPWVNRRDYPM
ncbi:DUF4875 domain-containing protein [Endozoicomonas sp. ALD040]|uniref:DUF4875 domain-containing protein n=1 Tax=Endozoicomonas sp. ALD040 TaxID=3403079 RepID=UPI003BAF19C4